jgi:hypothetical protein
MVCSALARSASRLAVGVVVAAALVGCIGGAGDDAAEDADPDATLSAPETLPPLPIEVTVPAETLPGEDGSAVAEVLADDAVAPDELAAVYVGYVECLADGGATGRYAYDIELRTGLVVDWTAEEGGSTSDVDRDVLSASCSRRFLGDLTRRFEQANPPADDLAARQRASLSACIERVSPQAAANLPAQIAVGTAGEAASLTELQLDPAALDPATLGADPEDTAAVSACIASMGAEWRPFG